MSDSMSDSTQPPALGHQTLGPAAARPAPSPYLKWAVPGGVALLVVLFVLFQVLTQADANTLFYWIAVPGLKIAGVMAVLPLFVAGFTLAERKIIGWIQVRLGPMRVGPNGIMQPFADVLKLFCKEDIVPTGATRFVFILAPVISIVPAFIVIAVLPFGPNIDNWDEAWYCAPAVWVANVVDAVAAEGEVDRKRPLPTGIVDGLDIGLLYILAVGSLGVFAILLAGWSSNSKYPLLGGLRSAAQMISYEVPLGFALIAGLLMAQTLNMQGIVEAQMNLGWSFFLLQPLSLFIYFVAGVAETNRVPFDLPEAETELVSGFHTEYSGMKFAFFFLAEYINMITVAAIAVTLFWGGWLPPLHGFWDKGGWAFSAPAGFIWFSLKIAAFYFLYFWLRATLPRYRYDQLMGLGWKFMIPLSLLNVMLVGFGVWLHRSRGWEGGWGLFAWAIVSVLVALFFVFIFRSRRGDYGTPAVRSA